MMSHNDNSLETSMETTSTYETYTTARWQQKTDNVICPSIFQSRRYLSNLLETVSRSSSSSSSRSSSSASHDSTAFRRPAATTSPHWCTSPTCLACRQAAMPRFVPANARRGSLPSAQRRWWESSTLTAILSDQLGEWVDTKLMRACHDNNSSAEHTHGSHKAVFGYDMEEDHKDEDDVDDVSTVPYDEKEGDPRYASF